MSVAVGVAADRLLGEPPDRVHPVAMFGRAMHAVEQRLHRDSRIAGIAHAGVGLGIGLAAGAVVRSPAVATYVAVAGRMLGTTALEIGRILEAGDLDEARARLPSLVGRDPSRLDEGELARAVVESVAENTVDAIVAPVLWGAAFGAPGALAHRAANTMDAMVGHRSDRYRNYGWAAARLDDAMAWLPARVTAAAVAAVRPSAAGEVWRAVRLDAPTHPSPNAGVAEAAFAAALRLRLGGPVRYGDEVEERPVVGRGRPTTAADIPRAVRLSEHVTLAVTALTLGKSRRSR